MLSRKLDSGSESTRWAGIGVALSGFALIITIVIYGAILSNVAPSEPGLEITTADKVNHLRANWSLATAIWVTEAGLFALLAISALVMSGESHGGSKLFPKRAAWVTVGIGAILQTAMYAFMLGGYPAAMEAVETTPALFEALNGSAFFLFFLGNTAIFLGFAGLYLAEGLAGEVVSQRIGWIGSAICLSSMALLLAVAGGVLSMMVAVPFALIAHLLIGYFGIALYKTAAGTTLVGGND